MIALQGLRRQRDAPLRRRGSRHARLRDGGRRGRCARPTGSTRASLPAPRSSASRSLDSNGFGDEADLVAGIQWAVDEQGHLRHRGRQPLARVPRLLRRDRRELAGRQQRARRGPRDGGRGRERGTGPLHRQLAGRRREGTHGGRQWRTSARTASTSTSRRAVAGRPTAGSSPTSPHPGSTSPPPNAGTSSGYVEFTGTSMATPFVAGVALLMLDASPGLTPQQVKDKITGHRGGLGEGRRQPHGGIDRGRHRLRRRDAWTRTRRCSRRAPPSVRAAARAGARAARGHASPVTGDQDDYPLSVPDTMFPIACDPDHADDLRRDLEHRDFDLYPPRSERQHGGASSEVHHDRQEELGFTSGGDRHLHAPGQVLRRQRAILRRLLDRKDRLRASQGRHAQRHPARARLRVLRRAEQVARRSAGRSIVLTAGRRPPTT